MPDSLQILFVRTFVEGFQNPAKRVDSGEWIAALKKTIAEKLLVRCQDNRKHYYFAHRMGCPLCEVEQQIREMNQRWSSDPLPDPLPDPPSDPPPVPPPVPPPKPIHKKMPTWEVIMIAVASIFCVCVLGMAVVMDEGWWPLHQEEVYVCPEVYTADGTEVAGQEYRILLQENYYPTESDYEYILPLYDYGGGTDVATGTYYASLYLLDEEGYLNPVCDINDLVDIGQDDWDENCYITLALPEGVDIVP